MFFGHSLATIGRKSAISASSLALGCTPWSLPREQYGLVTALHSIELDGSQKSLFRERCARDCLKATSLSANRSVSVERGRRCP